MGIHYNEHHGVLDYIKNKEVYTFTDGFASLPEKDGLGIEVNRELVLEENGCLTDGRIRYGDMRMDP